jgi:Arc/MetJ-type ribon-helix-helix transcriptional regulator
MIGCQGAISGYNGMLSEHPVADKGLPMATDLSPENEHFLRELVNHGTYPNEASALNEAVELLRRRREIVSRIEAGLEQAERGELLPENEVWERLERHAAELDDAAK